MCVCRCVCVRIQFIPRLFNSEEVGLLMAIFTAEKQWPQK